MQNEIQPAPPEPQQTIEMEADAQTARLVTEHKDALAQRAKSAECLLVRSVIVGISFPLVAGLLALTLLGRSHPFTRLILFEASLLGLLWIAFIVYGRLWIAPRLNVAQLVRSGGVKAIPALFTAFQKPSFPLNERAARDALTTLLPQIKKSEAYILTPDALELIRDWIKGDRDFAAISPYPDALRIAALKALEKVSDPDAIFYVERLTHMSCRTPGQEKVKQAAIECLPMLKARCGNVETAQMLRCASQAEDAST